MGRKPCCSKIGLNKGAWTSMEDKILMDYIQVHHGPSNWSEVPEKAGLKRCGKSCRLRWINYLRPDIKRGNITEDEEELIIRLHKLLGNRWSLIAGRLPGRTDNEIKNYWHTNISKRLQVKTCNQVEKLDQSQERPNRESSEQEKIIENHHPYLAIRPKPIRLRRKPPSFRASVEPSTAVITCENNSGGYQKENETTGISMKDFDEMAEKFFSEFLEFEGSLAHYQQCSPCINDDLCGGVLFSEEMLHAYSKSLMDPESDFGSNI